MFLLYHRSTGGGYTVLPLSVLPIRRKIFFVTFFSATIDGRNLIFGHKLHIGMPYRGKSFWTRHIPTSCLPTWLVFIHIEHICGGYHKWVLAHNSSCFEFGFIYTVHQYCQWFLFPQEVEDLLHQFDNRITGENGKEN